MTQLLRSATGFVYLALAFSLDSASARELSCIGDRTAIPIDNQQVLHWKRSTPNQFKQRAHVEGWVTRSFSGDSSHLKFEISLGDGPADTLEVVYNRSFGACPTPRPGTRVVACGDYITSYAPAGHYPASPSGALIHWVHSSRNEAQHPSGFLIVGGKVCGTQLARERDR